MFTCSLDITADRVLFRTKSLIVKLGFPLLRANKPPEYIQVSWTSDDNLTFCVILKESVIAIFVFCSSKALLGSHAKQFMFKC